VEETGNPVTFVVYSTVGTGVYTEKTASSGGIEHIHIPGFSKGMYILNVDTGKGSRNFKIFRY